MKRNALLFAIAVLVLGGVGWKLTVDQPAMESKLEGKRQESSDFTTTSASSPHNPARSSEGASETQPQETVIDDSSTSRGDAQVSRRVDTTPDVRGETASSAGIALGAAGEDEHVIGRPFPVSHSIKTACESHDREGLDAWSCDGIYRRLDDFAKEPREEPWATLTEAKLAAFVQSHDGAHVVRALECRKSICFLESVSRMGPMAGPGYEDRKELRLSRELEMLSYEVGEDNSRLTVTLIPLRRR